MWLPELGIYCLGLGCAETALRITLLLSDAGFSLQVLLGVPGASSLLPQPGDHMGTSLRAVPAARGERGTELDNHIFLTRSVVILTNGTF